jgi:hypothetical protein
MGGQKELLMFVNSFFEKLSISNYYGTIFDKISELC